MKNLLFLMLCLSVVGCQPAPDLRVDDLFFGNKRVGRQAENPVFQPGESFEVHFKVRGLTPDEEGYGVVSYTTQFTHPMDGNPNDAKKYRFKIKSDMTHVEGKPVTFVVPDDADGTGMLTITVTDETSGKVIKLEAPYTVAK
jgi:hypothetical protein